MEAPAIPPEPKKSFSAKSAALWAAMITWLSKLFIIIAVVLAFAAAYYFLNFYVAIKYSVDKNEFFVLGAICWLIAFVTIYALLYLLKHLILAGLILSPFFIFFYLHNGKIQNVRAPKIDPGIFCFNCKDQNEKLDAANKKIDSVNYKIDSLNRMVMSMKIKIDSLKK